MYVCHPIAVLLFLAVHAITHRVACRMFLNFDESVGSTWTHGSVGYPASESTRAWTILADGHPRLWVYGYVRNIAGSDVGML